MGGSYCGCPGQLLEEVAGTALPLFPAGRTVVRPYLVTFWPLGTPSPMTNIHHWAVSKRWPSSDPTVVVLVAKLCPALCDLVDCSPPSSSVHGINQARILEWVAVFFVKGSSWPRDQAHILCRSPVLHVDSLPLSHWEAFLSMSLAITFSYYVWTFNHYSSKQTMASCSSYSILCNFC